MTPAERQDILAYSTAIAKILYKNTDVKELTSLGKIEEAVRDGMQEHIMPEVGVFLLKMSQEKVEDTKGVSKVSSEN
jgi:uncharacterized protein Yka (UPF0111/DUF47 family)